MQLKKKSYLSELFSKPIVVTVFLLAILIAIIMPLARNIKQQYAINSEIAQLDNEIKSFEAKNLSLKEKMKYLQSDQFANEQAKLNLNYKKEGEEVVVISTSTAAPENSKLASDDQNLSDDEKNSSDANNAVRWWRYFFY